MALTADHHNHVLQWAHTLEQQILRLRQGRLEAMAAQKQVWLRRVHTAQDNQPFHRMRADTHFAMTACLQLFRALNKFDGNLRLETHLNAADLRSFRNALEHWDEDDGPGARAMNKLGANPRSHTWNQEGAGRLGDLVDDEDLLQWARAVYAELVDFNPPPQGRQNKACNPPGSASGCPG